MDAAWWKADRYSPIMVAIPAIQWMWTASVQSVLDLSVALPPGSHIDILEKLSTPAASRNALIERFKRAPQYSHIFFLDSDMTVPQHAALRLLSHGVDVVGARCYWRYPPYLPAYAPLQSGTVSSSQNPLQEMDWIGGACLMVSREVIDKVSFPWFESPESPGFGEDMLFARKVRGLGYSVFLDTGLSAGHIETRAVTHLESEEFRGSARGQEVEREWMARPMSSAGLALEAAMSKSAPQKPAAAR